MSKLYFGICPFGSIADVFINLLAGWSDEWVQPCTPDINPNGYPIHRVHQPYVLDLTNNNPMMFRNIDWTHRLQDIQDVLDKNDGKKVWIGTFDPSQEKIIKDNFENATTIGISYGSDLRAKVLDNAVSYYDISNIEDVTLRRNAFLEKYQSEKVKWDNRVPISFTPSADVLFDLNWLYDPSNVIAFIESIDGKRNQQQLSYYYKWLAKENKEYIYESI